MNDISRTTLQRLFQDARRGKPQALGPLLESFRNYFNLLAAAQIDKKLQVRCSPSDVVQETFLEAHRDFGQFIGKTQEEFLAWLRRILINNLMRSVDQHVRAQRRCVHREISLGELEKSLGRSAAGLEGVLAARDGSPSAIARRHEAALALADHLAGMSPDYREILILRHLKGLPFAEIAEQMNRTSGAVRMLWLRAMEQLRRRLTPGCAT